MKLIVLAFLILAVALIFYFGLNRRFSSLFFSVNPSPSAVSPFLPLSPTPSFIPKKHLITAPFIPQAPESNWDQPWQDACEEAALLTVYYYFLGLKPSVDTIKTDINAMISYETSRGYSRDIDLSQMAEIAQYHLGLNPLLIDGNDRDIIKSYLLKDIPVIIAAAGKILFKENPNFRQGGPYYHNLVILGYDDTKNQFIVHDVGTRRGRNFRYSYDLLSDSIHDLPPDHHKENITSGDRRFLILLK